MGLSSETRNRCRYRRLAGGFFVYTGMRPRWYNFSVPTPFYHLSLAEELIRHPSLPDRVRRFLGRHRCVFLFGHMAPDVQVVSGQRREETHFFSLPVKPGASPPWEHMLRAYPSLSQVETLPAVQVAFLAGFLCHLQADWFWVTDVFAPAFGPTCSWGTFRERLYLHNVLRAYLDRMVLSGLSSGMDGCLRKVAPLAWLPFVEDEHLCMWRDLLFPQLRSGGVAETVEVFANRQGRPAVEYYDLLASEERMQQEIFTHLSPQRLVVYRQRMLDEHVRLLRGYLVHAADSIPDLAVVEAKDESY